MSSIPRHLMKKSEPSAENYRCQKCLELGHFTYQCTGKRKYIHRDSRTKEMAKQQKLDQEEKKLLALQEIKALANVSTKNHKHKVKSKKTNRSSDSTSSSSSSDSDSSSSSSSSSSSDDDSDDEGSSSSSGTTDSESDSALTSSSSDSSGESAVDESPRVGKKKKRKAK